MTKVLVNQDNKKVALTSNLLTTGINVSHTMPNLPNLLESLVDIGYKYVYIDGDTFTATKDEVARFHRLLNKTPLKVFSAHSPYMYPELGKDWQSYLGVHEHVFATAKLFGAECVTHHFAMPVGLPDGGAMNFASVLKDHDLLIEQYKQLNIELLHEMADLAKQYELSITIENLPIGYLGDLGTTIESLLGIVKATSQENVGICIDSGHGFISGLDLHASIVAAGEHLFETHFHDNFGRTSRLNKHNDRHLPVGLGDIDWKKVIVALREIRFAQPVVFELHSTRITSEVARLNYAHWRDYVSQVEAGSSF